MVYFLFRSHGFVSQLPWQCCPRHLFSHCIFLQMKDRGQSQSITSHSTARVISGRALSIVTHGSLSPHRSDILWYNQKPTAHWTTEDLWQILLMLLILSKMSTYVLDLSLYSSYCLIYPWLLNGDIKPGPTLSNLTLSEVHRLKVSSQYQMVNNAQNSNMFEFDLIFFSVSNTTRLDLVSNVGN